MASVIKAGNATDGVQVTSDNTGILELKTGTGAGTTAVTIGTNQAVTFAGAVTLSGNQTVTGNLTVDGNTTLGNANTDTILMTAAPSIGGAGLGMGFGFRNRIINGAMVIDQRNAGASVTSAANGTYFLDRWRNAQNVNSKFSIQQNAGSVTPPAGFTNYLGVTSLSAYSVAAGEVAAFGQSIEGFNVADLAWGTANAQTITISFWVRSSLTGTFAGAIQNQAQNRSYLFTFAISSANTWEQKAVTIAGDTTGTWLTNNSGGLLLWFSLGTGANFQGTANAWGAGEKYGVSGQVNVIGTNGATFYITGVQLEKGSTATSFDYRPYGTELQLCQRYFQFVTFLDGGLAIHYAPGGSLGGYTQMDFFPVPMRAAPTGTFSQVGILKVAQYTGVADGNTTSVTTATTDNAFKAVYGGTGYSGSTTTPLSLYMGNSRISFSAEL